MNHVVLHDGWLRVSFDRTQKYADFHFRWLRHNCNVDRHPLTRERTVDSSDLPDGLGVREACINGDELHITWQHDGRKSRYSLSWLLEHAYALNRTSVESPPSDVQALEVNGLSLANGVKRAVELLATRGAAIVRRDRSDKTPPEDETEAIIDLFGKARFSVVGTHFGRIEDLRTDNTTNQNTDQLGYTDAGIELHTDQPFIPSPPPIQLLQSIRRADRGGENYLVDAFAAGAYLDSIDRRARELLATVPVRFHRRQAAFESVVEAPILSETSRGPVVRYSYFTMAPHRLPFAEMEEWYRAYDRYARIVRDPANQYRFTLAPGDYLVYDNHRMLHARTAFSGPRWVRGVYFTPTDVVA